MIFPVSGVEVNPLIPPLIALVVSTFTLVILTPSSEISGCTMKVVSYSRKGPPRGRAGAVGVVDLPAR